MTTDTFRGQQTTTSAAIPHALADVRSRPVVWWGVTGAFFWALQFYVIGSWIFSDYFKPTLPGPDPLPTATYWALMYVQVVFGVSAIWGFWHIFRTVQKTGKLSTFNLIQIGWVAMTWQDLILGYLRPQFTFNAHMVNFGSWGAFIPGWISPNSHLMPEPLAMQPSMYVALVPFMVMTGVWTMRWAKKRWPSLSGSQLVLICFAVLTVNDAINEGLLCYLGVFAYTGVIAKWSIFAGTPEQFPLYEAVIYSVMITLSSVIVYFTDEDGKMFIERGIDRVKGGNGKRQLVRALAASGYVNLTLLIYAVFMIWVSLYIDSRPQMPSYLDSGICGGTSGVECPAPGVPIIPLPAGPGLTGSAGLDGSHAVASPTSLGAPGR